MEDDVSKTKLRHCDIHSINYTVGRCPRCADTDIPATLDSPMHSISMPGMKFDSGKLNWSLLPVPAIEETIKVLMFGAKKYSKDNWRNVDNAGDRYYSAAMRHITSWQKGEKVDSETGVSHLAHAMCCLIFLLELEEKRND